MSLLCLGLASAPTPSVAQTPEETWSFSGEEIPEVHLVVGRITALAGVMLRNPDQQHLILEALSLSPESPAVLSLPELYDEAWIEQLREKYDALAQDPSLDQYRLGEEAARELRLHKARVAGRWLRRLVDDDQPIRPLLRDAFLGGSGMGGSGSPPTLEEIEREAKESLDALEDAYGGEIGLLISSIAAEVRR